MTLGHGWRKLARGWAFARAARHAVGEGPAPTWLSPGACSAAKGDVPQGTEGGAPHRLPPKKSSWRQLLEFYTAHNGSCDAADSSLGSQDVSAMRQPPSADSLTGGAASAAAAGGGQGSDSDSEGGRAERKREAVRKALEDGTLGLGFSAGGFLYCYHLGVLWELRRLGILPEPGNPRAIKMAGASAGSLAIATYACGLDVDKSTEALLAFAADCRQNGTRGRLGLLLRDFLHAYLPPDAHERCKDLTYVAVTRVFPVWQPELVHRFKDKDDLVSALITSCHIPFYANGEWMTQFRGRYYMDGGVASFIPRPPTKTVIKVCCFPVSDILSRVQPSIQSYEYVASLLDVSISPDSYEPWPHPYQTLLSWALVPAEDDTLKYLIDKGRRDAHAWAAHMQLIPEQTAAEAAAEAAGGRLMTEGGVLLPEGVQVPRARGPQASETTAHVPHNEQAEHRLEAAAAKAGAGAASKVEHDQSADKQATEPAGAVAVPGAPGATNVVSGKQ